MAYRTTCNLDASGVQMSKDSVYRGPQDLIPKLLKDGLIVEDKSIAEPVYSQVDEYVLPDEPIEEEKPKKSKRKK